MSSIATTGRAHDLLGALTTEHDDLDAAIVALLAGSMFDDLLLTRLKKRKLQIKDEIAALLCALQPEQKTDGASLLNIFGD